MDKKMDDTYTSRRWRLCKVCGYGYFGKHECVLMKRNPGIFTEAEFATFTPEEYVKKDNSNVWSDEVREERRIKIEKKEDKPTIAYGWRCPICGTVYAPWISVCSNWHGSFTATTDRSNIK